MTTGTDVARAELISVKAGGWRTGFANLLRKEFGQWWRTKLWWIQTLIWVVILNGITTAVMLDTSGLAPAALMDEAISVFLLVGAAAIGIGVVITIQGAIVGEKELGTAAWVMSKPVSRAAYVLSKLTAHFVGFAVTALLIPAVVFIVESTLLISAPIRLGPFLLGMGVMALNVLFYVVFTLALGCVFKGRGPVAGIGIGLSLVGMFFEELLPQAVVMATPWLLGEVAVSHSLGRLPGFNRVVPVVLVGIVTLTLGFLAVWRFQHEEL